MKNLPSILLLIFSIIVVTAILLHPEVSFRQGKTLLKTSAAIFFIPSNQLIKVYTTNSNTQNLNQIVKDDTDGTDADFGIYIKNLNTNEQATLNSNQSFNSASLYKLFVMYTIFDKARAGQLDINNQDIQDNLNAMITVSSNDAALYLVEQYTSWQEITDKMHALGLNDTDLDIDTPTTTPEDVGKLLELIANGKAVDFDSSVKMLDLMTQQTRRDRIPADLPAGTVIANKTGELDDVLHDAAVVGTDKSDYVIVLMSRSSGDLDKTRTTMQKTSEDVYNYFDSEWNTFPEIL